ncbi:hypothetical protein M2421_003865 [Stenotrophomonas sp. BIGb0135]|nr:hypothetical protein [Stenotrophomonas sp. BIGb0135]
MDRSIIEPARERARVASNTPRTVGLAGCSLLFSAWRERKQTQPNATRRPRRLQLWLANHGDSNLYWACTLLFATGVLLALLSAPVATPYSTMGGQCHANH